MLYQLSYARVEAKSRTPFGQRNGLGAEGPRTRDPGGRLDRARTPRVTKRAVRHLTGPPADTRTIPPLQEVVNVYPYPATFASDLKFTLKFVVFPCASTVTCCGCVPTELPESS